MNLLKSIIKGNKGFLFFIALMFMFRSAIADWNHVPTGSMKPTIEIGDRILVNKLAYDLRVPFTTFSLLHRSDPVVGDIVVFESHAAGNRLVKRVIAIPGDTVSMSNNRLTINGRALQYKTSGELGRYWEAKDLGIQADKAEVSKDKSRYQIQVTRDDNQLASFSTITVPSERYLVLGDNRDNSADSRVIGLVPRKEIIGRSRSVVMSFNYDNYYLPRSNRFFKSL